MTRNCTDRTRQAAPFFKAAVLLEKSDGNYHGCGCCYAITQAGGKGYLPEGREGRLMNQYFPEGMCGAWGRYGENKERIIALCFMAAMVEAGDA